jgi:hypothetical protein
MVRPVKGDGGLRPPEERGRGWLDRVDLVARELLAMLGVISRHPTEDHEVSIYCRKAASLLLGVVRHWLWLPSLVPLLGATRQELLHEGAILVQVLDREGMV